MRSTDLARSDVDRRRLIVKGRTGQVLAVMALTIGVAALWNADSESQTLVAGHRFAAVDGGPILVDADGLPVVTARERHRYEKLTDLVGYSDAVVVGRVENMTHSRTVGSSQSPVDFYRITISVEEVLAGSATGTSIIVELNGVQTPGVSEQWPLRRGRVLIFLEEHSLREGEFQLLGSQGLFEIDGDTVRATVSDRLAASFDGRDVGTVLSAVRQAATDLVNGVVQLTPRPQDEPIPMGPQHGAEPDAEAEREADGSAAIEP